MICSSLEGASISGEAKSFDCLERIRKEHLAALYVAIKHITQEGKEALENLKTYKNGDKIVVRLRHWKICYQEVAESLRFESLQYEDS